MRENESILLKLYIAKKNLWLDSDFSHVKLRKLIVTNYSKFVFDSLIKNLLTLVDDSLYVFLFSCRGLAL